MNSPLRYSGVVLAGGRSARMGSDKATLLLEGQPLLDRQIALLRRGGAAEVLVSRRADSTRSPLPLGVGEVLDAWTDAGPLGGLERALEEARHELLVTLAVDLPAITDSFLATLVARSRGGRGVVPVSGGRFEPLVAVYPRAARALAIQELTHGRRAMHDFARACLEAGLVTPHEISPAEQAQFVNWNFPSDLPAIVRAAAFSTTRPELRVVPDPPSRATRNGGLPALHRVGNCPS